MLSLQRALPVIAMGVLVACQRDTVAPEAPASQEPSLARGGATPPPDPAIAYFNTEELWVMNADGTNQTRLASAPSNTRNPSWSPDGASICYRSSGTIMRVDISVANNQIQVGTPVALRQPSKLWHVAWSPAPAGTPTYGKIAYSQGPATSTTSSSIVLIPASGPSTDGDEITVYTAPVNHHVWEIAWNPMGTKIAFVEAPAYPADEHRVKVLDLTNGTVTQVAQFIAGIRGLAWARTQDKLTFSAPVKTTKGAINTLFTLDLASGTLIKLIAGFFPVWSPSDDKLVFDKSGFGSLHTYTFSTGASTTRALAQGTRPDWRR